LVEGIFVDLNIYLHSTPSKRMLIIESKEWCDMSVHNGQNKVSVTELVAKKQHGQKIVMLTAYDFPGAQYADAAGVDMILVGDSLAMTVLGYPDTVSLTMEEMLHHCRAVSRGASRAFLVGDMPFMSYQADKAEAIRNAGRMLKEGRMDAVKLEGGKVIAPTIRAIVGAGILVVGHIGLTPQSATKLGGYKVQGKTAELAKLLLDDALALQEAGCFCIVLEAIPAEVAEVITAQLNIPTIGIGAGKNCDGQVLVYHDMLGMFDKFVPKFVKRYAQLGPVIVEAIAAYCQEVREGTFPTTSHSFFMNEQERTQFHQWLETQPQKQS
jgi:3-methyl-2-oxobutanoate hydroxymethyltransferase